MAIKVIDVSDISLLADVRRPSQSEIDEYRNTTDASKRIELAYAYQISREDLFPEDLEEILKDLDKALNES